MIGWLTLTLIAACLSRRWKTSPPLCHPVYKSLISYGQSCKEKICVKGTFFDDIYIFFQDDSGSTLTMTDVSVSDSGNYSCQVCSQSSSRHDSNDDHVEVDDNNDDGGNNDGNDNVKSVSTLKILAANITLTEYYLIIIIMMMMMTRVAWPPLTVTKS